MLMYYICTTRPHVNVLHLDNKITCSSITSAQQDHMFKYYICTTRSHVQVLHLYNKTTCSSITSLQQDHMFKYYICTTRPHVNVLHLYNKTTCSSITSVQQDHMFQYYICTTRPHVKVVIHGMNQQIVSGSFDLYLALFITIKSDMKTAQEIVRNLINEYISLIGRQFIKTRCVIFGDNQYMSKHTFNIQNSSIYWFKFDLLHMLIC